jgi:ribosomal-protein-alanine N-acetyltransferase
MNHQNNPEEKISVRQLLWEETELNQILKIEQSSFNKFDAYTLEDFKRWYGFNPDLCLVAEIDRSIAGYLVSRVLKDKLDLASLAINPAYRRRGVGAALLEYAEMQMEKYKLKVIELEVRKTNSIALAFWQRMGFAVFGSQPDFYEDGEEAVLMRKFIY